MKKLHSRYKKKGSVVFMGLTVSGLPEKAVAQLLGFLAAGSEVMSAAIQGSKNCSMMSLHLPRACNTGQLPNRHIKTKESYKETANRVLWLSHAVMMRGNSILCLAEMDCQASEVFIVWCVFSIYNCLEYVCWTCKVKEQGRVQNNFS